MKSWSVVWAGDVEQRLRWGQGFILARSGECERVGDGAVAGVGDHRPVEVQGGGIAPRKEQRLVGGVGVGGCFGAGGVVGWSFPVVRPDLEPVFGVGFEGVHVGGSRRVGMQPVNPTGVVADLLVLDCVAGDGGAVVVGLLPGDLHGSGAGCLDGGCRRTARRAGLGGGPLAQVALARRPAESAWLRWLPSSAEAGVASATQTATIVIVRTASARDLLCKVMRGCSGHLQRRWASLLRVSRGNDAGVERLPTAAGIIGLWVRFAGLGVCPGGKD